MNQSFVVKNRAAADVTFTLQSADTSGATYIVTSSNMTEPTMCAITRNVRPVGSTGADRYTVKFSSSKIDANGALQTVSASMMLVVPRSVVITDTLVNDVCEFAGNFVKVVANIDAFRDGIIP